MIAYGQAVVLPSVSRAVLFLAVVPAVSVIVGIPIVAEIPSLLQIAGLILVTAGLLTTIGLFRRSPTNRPKHLWNKLAQILSHRRKL